MDFQTSKIVFTGISKPHKEFFLNLLKENNIKIAKKQITPIYKVQFQGKIYFNTFQDYAIAKKLFQKAKETDNENYKKQLEIQRKQLEIN